MKGDVLKEASPYVSLALTENDIQRRITNDVIAPVCLEQLIRLDSTSEKWLRLVYRRLIRDRKIA